MTDYRDVTPNAQKTSSSSVMGIFNYIFVYLKNPLEGVKLLPSWSWGTLIVCTGLIAALTGMISGLIAGQFFRVLSGLLITPIMGVILSFIASLLLYYYFQVFEKKTCSLKQLYTLVLFANIPFFIFQIAAELIPPISLVGFAFTGLLLVVGLTENFQLEKKRSIKLVSVLYGIFTVIWIVNLLQVNSLFK